MITKFMCKVQRFLWGIGLLLTSQVSFAQEQNVRSLALQDLFELADQNNRQLQILNNQQQIAKHAIKIEEQKLLPSVDATLMFSYIGNGYITDRDFSNGMSVDIPHFGNNFIVEAKQLLYAGGAVKTSIDMAKTNLLINELETETNRQNLRFGISAYYLELLKLKNQRLILVKNIEQTNKLITQIKSKNKEGVALKNNITRYELQKQSLEVNLLKLDNTVKIVNNDLVKILQLPKETILEIQEIEMIEDLNDETFWKNEAQANASVLKKTGLQVAQALKGEQLVKSQRLPQFFAFAGNYFNGPVMIEIPVLNNNFNYWNVGVGVKYDVSTLFKNEEKEKQASILIQNAKQNELIVKEQLDHEIETAKIRFEETKDIYQTHLKGVELSNQNYTVIRNRYLNDMALTTEMLDAENTKLDAELQAANSQINILFQYYQLKKLTGTL